MAKHMAIKTVRQLEEGAEVVLLPFYDEGELIEGKMHAHFFSFEESSKTVIVSIDQGKHDLEEGDDGLRECIYTQLAP
jgi:uncharacterized protein YdeI (BOF family)